MSSVTHQGPEGSLTPRRLASLMAAIGARTGLDVADAQLIKFTNNAVFRLPRISVVVRIAGSTAIRHAVEKIVQVAGWLADHDVPAVRLLPGVAQPLVIDGHTITLWEETPAVETVPTSADLGAILRQIHALPQPNFVLPQWDKLAGIRQRLAEPEGVEPVDLAFLLDRCDEVEAMLGKVRPTLPPGPIHGDGTRGNLIAGPGGPVICDFDSTSIGPREWDLVPTAVGRLRFDFTTDTQGQLMDSYGFDVTAWEGFEAFRLLRELQLVTSVIPILRSNPTVRHQWRHRLSTFRTGDTTAKWTRYT